MTDYYIFKIQFFQVTHILFCQTFASQLMLRVCKESSVGCCIIELLIEVALVGNRWVRFMSCRMMG